MDDDPLQRYSRELKEKLSEFDNNLTSARIISRDIIYKIILLCSTIIGFSITLVSISGLELKIDLPTLKNSWYLFLSTIVVGFFTLFLEGRLHYVLKWRSFQVQQFEGFKYSLIERIKVYTVTIHSLISPRNLIFCRIYKTAEEKRYNAFLNGKTVLLLAEIEKITFFLENIFVIIFIFALFVFIRSYQ